MALLVSLAFSSGAAAHAGAVREEDLLQAAFVYNFTRFTRWPESVWENGEGRLRLCIAGRDGLAEALQRLSGRTVNGRSIEVRPFAASAASDDCHVLYVAAPAAGGPAEVPASVRGRPVLTVSRSRGALGPIIRLFEKENRIRFSIDLGEAALGGLAFSSRLLELAEEIR